MTDDRRPIVSPARLGPSSRLFVARAIGLTASIVTVLITARVLGPEGRGHVASFAVLTMTASTILGFGMGIGAYSLTASDGVDATALAPPFVLWACLVVGATTVIALATGAVGLLEAWVGPGGVILAPMAGLAAGTQFLSLGFTQFATGLGRSGVTALGYGLPSICIMIATLVAAVVMPSEPGFIGAQVAGWIVAATAMVVVLGLPIRPSSRGLRRLVARARTAGVGEVANALSYRLDVLILGPISGAGSVGIYSLAVQVLEPIWIVSSAASTGLLIRLRNIPRSEWWKTTSATLPLVIGLTALGAAGAIVLLPIMIAFVGRGFDQSQQVALVLAPGIVMLAVSKVLAAYNIASGRLGMSSFVGVATVVVTTALDLALMPRFGAIGAGIASSVGYGLSMVIWIVASRRLAQRPDIANRPA